ncbi:hypothetical protein K502DRAFT_363198 [Neoconidiobolus thromboides FSU 785]|nr:hypothetical protein K502DRAFT_363198 [Neoconidiobolus thromboides FSU 785]
MLISVLDSFGFILLAICITIEFARATSSLSRLLGSIPIPALALFLHCEISEERKKVKKDYKALLVYLKEGNEFKDTIG